MLKSLILLLVSVFLSLAGPVMAQEVTGKISAQFDGKDMQWYVLDEGENSQSSWYDLTSLHQVTIWGQLEGDKSGTPKGAVIVSFLVMNATRQNPNAMDVTIQFMRDGYGGIFINADGAKPRVKLDKVTVEGKKMRLQGSFEGVLHLSTDMLDTMDMADPKAISGTFDVTIDQKTL